MKKQISETHATLKGHIAWSVVSNDGSIVSNGEHKNLILDAGLDKAALVPFAECFNYAVVGTGSTAPATSQVGLAHEISRTNGYLTSPIGSCGTTVTSNTLALKRTFNFPIGSLDSSRDGDYTEIGFSDLGASGNNLFSRALFLDEFGSPVGVAITSEQMLRVAYTLTITIGSVEWLDGSVTITNLGATAYKQRFQHIGGIDGDAPDGVNYHLNHVTSSGVVGLNTAMGTAMSLEPSLASDNSGCFAYGFGFVNTDYPDNTTIPAVGTDLTTASLQDAATVGWAVSAYTPGDFYVDRTLNLDVNTGNGDLQWLLGPQLRKPSAGPFDSHGAQLIYFPTPISKDNLHLLSLVTRLSWARA